MLFLPLRGICLILDTLACMFLFYFGSCVMVSLACFCGVCIAWDWVSYFIFDCIVHDGLVCCNVFVFPWSVCYGLTKMLVYALRKSPATVTFEGVC